MTQEELNKVLEAHKHYLAQDCQGWENMKANLREANIRGANLRGAYLTGANLTGADLGEAYLGGAYLGEANLREADLRRADLEGAYLEGAYLGEANLGGANLIGANLTGADLREADLIGADLRGADLGGANLGEANLREANLGGANLIGANLGGVIYDVTTAFFALTCPEEGDFVAWKKVSGVIVKLRVPAEARRSSATTRKCRCEYAEVLALQNIDGTPYEKDEVVNYNYSTTIYKVGEIVRPDSWDEDRWNECSHGIHFFITRDEAVRY